MQSRSYLFLLLVLGLSLLSGFLYTQKGYQFGLDVRGGVRFTYEIDQSKLTAEHRRNMDQVRRNIRRILENRAVGPLGVTEPIVIQRGLDQYVIELPGFTDPERARETLGTSASIEFYHAKNIKTAERQFRPYDAKDAAEADSPRVHFLDRNGKEIKPGDPEYAKIIEGWDLILKGDDLAQARPQITGSGSIPELIFSENGAKKMETWSRRYTNSGEMIAEVLDGVVLSIAPLQKGAILSNQAVITGQFSGEYVRNLTQMLNSGALPVDLNVVSAETVDPVIGQHALSRIVVAGGISFAIIGLFLIVYYAFPGLVALVALLLYVLFTLTALKLFGATFSLAAIAGFILSVGMAVDANILVFERFKEEMKRGKSLEGAIDLGFRRALPAIIDSNACTILTSIVLVNLGTGPVKGFATTLIIGVAISLLTAVFITRSLLVFLTGSGIANNPKWYAVDRSWFGENLEQRANDNPLQIVNNSKKWFIVSGAILLPGFLFILLGGLKPNVEFRGGYEAIYAVSPERTAGEIAGRLEAAGLRGGNVKISSSGRDKLAIISLPPLAGLANSGEAIPRIAEAIGVQPGASKGFTQIGPSIQRETLYNAILAVVLSSALIIIYLAFRFGIALGGFMPGLRFGFSAIGAMMHDVLIILGVAAMMGFFLNWEISALFITAMLTVIGFSVHDTIVIFDRIRENLRRPLPGEDFAHLVNRSITQSFARSINTSMTVIATLLILVIYGAATIDLRFFALTMLVGIVAGTFSSIYNASPILYLWDRAVGRKRGEQETLVGIANNQMLHHRIVSTKPAEADRAETVGASGRTYGQVRRRAKPESKGHVEIEED